MDKTRADALYSEGRYQLDEKLLKTMMKHEVRCFVAGAQMCHAVVSVP